MNDFVVRSVLAAAAACTLTVLVATGAQAATAYPSDTTPPDLVSLLQGYGAYWTPDPQQPLHGAVKDAAGLAWNDELASWINQNATPAERTLALQDSSYQNKTGTTTRPDSAQADPSRADTRRPPTRRPSR